MSDGKYRPNILLRYFFPCLFVILFALELSDLNAGYFDFHELLMLILELFIFYFMLYFLTVQYELVENRLIVHSFWLRKEVYHVAEILRIRDIGMGSLISKMPTGLNALVVIFKGRKDLLIIGLRNQAEFIADLQGKIRSAQGTTT